MDSEAAEPDENETDTDNYDVVYNLNPQTMEADATKKSAESSPASTGTDAAAAATAAGHLLPPPLPLPLRGSHSSLLAACGTGEPPSVPLPPPRGRRSVVITSHYSSSGSINRPSSAVLNVPDFMAPTCAASAVAAAASAAASDDDMVDGQANQRHSTEIIAGAGAQIHFSGDSQASQDSSKLAATVFTMKALKKYGHG